MRWTMGKPALSMAAVFLLLSCAAAGQHSAPAKTAHSATAPAESADAIWADLMRGNQRFVAGKPAAREYVKLRSRLAKGQSPKTIVLGCADSRVGPELLFDKSLGDLFVVRVAGSVAGPVDLASIEYAYEHLGSPLLVILGHSDCGAVKAACSGQALPAPNLEALGEKIRPACSKPGPSDNTQLSVEQNVRKSAGDVLANSPILREAVEQGKLHVIPAVYDLASGRVTRLKD